MAAKGEPVYYSAVPPEPSDHHHHHHHHHHHENNPNYYQSPPLQGQHYILLPLYHKRPSRFFSLRCLLLSGLILLLCLAVFFTWPSNPEIRIVGLRLNHVHIHTSSIVSLDISMPITVKVRNPDFFSLHYRSLVVSIEYRGRQLGFVTSHGGHLKARGSSYIDATLQLQGIQVYDVFYLLQDLARGSIPFETVTQFRGQLGLFFFDFPLKTKVSCEVIVDTDNQSIVRQNCYP